MKLVVFDLGHVIVEFNWTAVCEGFARRARIPRENFDLVLNYLGSLGYERGKISTAAFLSELNRILKLDLDLAEFTQLWNTTFEEDKEVTALMGRLNKQLPLYLLSNTNENHYQYIQQRFNIEKYFKELILSYRVGHIKPEAEIYDEVFKRSGLKPTECLFIDDLLLNIEAAHDLGMKTILYKGVEDLKQRLNQFGVTV
jgi:putative hydrolase of the HAD superfamily